MRLFLIATAVAVLPGGLQTPANAENAPCCGPAAAAQASSEDADTCELQSVLKRLHENAAELEACVAKLEYLFIESPDLLDAHSLRTGRLYYVQTDDRSRVRIDFETLKQDDFEPQQRREIFLFDGVWLTKVDYELEQVDRYQQAPEGEPIDAIEFISHHFPLVGFSGTRHVEAEFDVRLGRDSEDDPNLIHLVLDVPEDSRYSEDYSEIDFWIDRDLFLPRRIRALSTLGDIFDLRFFDIETDKKPEKQIFEIDPPAHFRKNIEPLKQ